MRDERRCDSLGGSKRILDPDFEVWNLRVGCRTTPMAANILQCVTRATQLQLRGWRNFSRFKQLTKGLIAADSPERLGWQRESAEEEVRDAEWNRRHGRIDGGADILRFKERADRLEPSANESRVQS